MTARDSAYSDARAREALGRLDELRMIELTRDVEVVAEIEVTEPARRRAGGGHDRLAVLDVFAASIGPIGTICSFASRITAAACPVQ
jgi:hypothetical protein